MKALLTISYDGTNYCGWQRQDGQMTVQQVIEGAISDLYAKDITIMGASRTDSGVHAQGQRASFTPPDARIPIDRLHLAINTRLPRDIRIVMAETVPDSFHVINDVKRKSYVYRIQNRAVYDPLLFRYSHIVREPLDVKLMKAGAEFFLGKHDFKAFCAAHSGAATTVRTVYEMKLTCDNDIISMEICGNGFLYNMIRIVMGTLLEVGRGKIKPSVINEIILSGRREYAGATVPAKGLTLIKINY